MKLHACCVTSWRTGSALLLLATVLLGIAALAGCEGSDSSNNNTSGLPLTQTNSTQIQQGRALVVSLGCTDCHNRGVDNPSSPNWMAGFIVGPPIGSPGSFQIGPFATYAANLTPDTTTGIGRFTDRQIYNAIKYGLDPEDTPDVVITGTTPGAGNFPATPHYLAPPMPWPAFRHLPDANLWSIVAYLKHGIKPVTNAVPDSQGPPDFWASSYTDAAIGPANLPAFPTANEQVAP
jgi:hypothetical protein